MIAIKRGIIIWSLEESKDDFGIATVYGFNNCTLHDAVYVNHFHPSNQNRYLSGIQITSNYHPDCYWMILE